ncbi:MAG: pentapeptide repeat-containing protein [Mesorhizobium sp.]|nr:pentapeptide repeat-containing protein [Mesorhizobium sp.]
MSSTAKGKEIATYKPLHLAHTNISKVENSDFRNSVLLYPSGKKAEFRSIDFSYMHMKFGYFHQAVFEDCKFVGSRFEECNFRNATFRNCDFRYAFFKESVIPTDEILENLPAEPNITKELLQNLRKNALSMGDVRSSRTFVLREIEATKEHLRRARRRDGNYYREKYSGFWPQFRVARSRILLAIDNALWGHGEKLWNMIYPILALIVISSAVSTYMSHNIENSSLPKVASVFWHHFLHYISAFLDVPAQHEVERVELLEWLIAISRYVAFGVLVAGIFRRFSHR